MDNAADLQIKSKQNNGLRWKLRVKSKNLCLLQIEALDTTIITIDDVQITVTIER